MARRAPRGGVVRAATCSAPRARVDAPPRARRALDHAVRAHRARTRAGPRPSSRCRPSADRSPRAGSRRSRRSWRAGAPPSGSAARSRRWPRSPRVRRARAHGLGEHVDFSLLEVMNIAGTMYTDLLNSMLGRPDVAGTPARSIELPSIEPTLDGWVGFNTNSRQQYRDFLLLIERTDLLEDEELARINGRWARMDEWNAAVRAWTTQPHHRRDRRARGAAADPGGARERRAQREGARAVRGARRVREESVGRLPAAAAALSDRRSRTRAAAARRRGWASTRTRSKRRARRAPRRAPRAPATHCRSRASACSTRPPGGPARPRRACSRRSAPT